MAGVPRFSCEAPATRTPLEDAMRFDSLLVYRAHLPTEEPGDTPKRPKIPPMPDTEPPPIPEGDPPPDAPPERL